MKNSKIEKLEKNGWKVGTVSEYLGLSEIETQYIELKTILTQLLQERRKDVKLSQEKLAKMIHSSQSRVAKMEANAPSVSIDLLVKTLFALGVSKKDLAKAFC